MRVKTIYSRPRVDRLLSETLHYPLTAVVAGAGYGKTTAARAYLSKSGVPRAFVTLTSGDGDAFWDKPATRSGPFPKRAPTRYVF